MIARLAQLLGLRKPESPERSEHRDDIITIRLADREMSIGNVRQLRQDDIKEMVRRKHDLDYQMSLCTRMMATGDILPFPFERAAILLRKARRYDDEITICGYIEDWCQKAERQHDGHSAMVWKSPKLQKCITRLPKARELSQRARAMSEE